MAGIGFAAYCMSDGSAMLPKTDVSCGELSTFIV